MILHGHVVVLVKECQVATLGAGETFGELGLQNLEKRTATVKVSPPTAFSCNLTVFYPPADGEKVKASRGVVRLFSPPVDGQKM